VTFCCVYFVILNIAHPIVTLSKPWIHGKCNYTCLCMCVCMYVYIMYLGITVRKYVCIMYVCMYVCESMRVFMYQYKCMQVCVYVYMYVYMRVCTFIYLFTF
jgi:hypothetical protein